MTDTKKLVLACVSQQGWCRTNPKFPTCLNNIIEVIDNMLHWISWGSLLSFLFVFFRGLGFFFFFSEPYFIRTTFIIQMEVLAEDSLCKSFTKHWWRMVLYHRKTNIKKPALRNTSAQCARDSLSAVMAKEVRPVLVLHFTSGLSESTGEHQVFHMESRFLELHVK